MFINFYIPNGSDVIKCRADDSHTEYFLALGAKMSEEAAKDKAALNQFIEGQPAPVESGDDGSGIPYSNEWHINMIKGMGSKEEIVNYTDGIDCPDYDKRGGLDIVKEKAIQALSND